MTDTITLYIPRVNFAHSSRDIRVIFLQQKIGSKVSVDIAYNPNTRYNMAFVTIEDSLNDNIGILKELLTKYSNIKLYPDSSRGEFWMLFPSKCDHKKDENELLEVPLNSTLMVNSEVYKFDDCKV